MKTTTIILIIAIIALGVFYIQKNAQDKSMFPEVLPEGGYCMVLNKTVSYTTMSLGNESVPMEYCSLSDFCEVYDASSSMSGKSLDQAALDKFQFASQAKGYTCFQDNARNTQRNFNNSNGSLIQSKFVCCNKKPTFKLGSCEPNTCNGRFTGEVDSKGCQLYALQLCNIDTTCTNGSYGQICSPRPFDDGKCTFKTLNPSGNTYFTSFTNCGIPAEKTCGSLITYCYNDACTKESKIEYTRITGKYVVGCGGYTPIAKFG